MPLKPDNKPHRDISNTLDNYFSGQTWYDKAARPIIHSGYHGLVKAPSVNQQELAQAQKNFTSAATELPKILPNIAHCVVLNPAACSNIPNNLITVVTGVAKGVTHAVNAPYLHQEELARSKDQMSKVFTGQQQTEYLKKHRENEKQQQ